MRTRSTFGRNSFLAVLIVVSITSSFARAQDAEDGIPPSRAPWFPRKVDQSDTKAVYPRSPGLAVGLSLGSTVLFSAIGGGMLAANSESVKIAGGVILGTGLVFGPAVGQAYSDRLGKAALFSLGRAGAGVLMTGGFFLAFASACWSDSGDRSNCGSQAGQDAGIAMMVIGGAALLGLTVWGIVDSYKSAKQYNEEYDKKSISLSPFVIPSSGGNGENGTAYGLAVAGNF